jgi:hypothetical protein
VPGSNLGHEVLGGSALDGQWWNSSVGISAGSVSAESVQAIRTDELGCRTVHARAPDQLAARHALRAAAIFSGAAGALAASATTRAHPIQLGQRGREQGRHGHEFVISVQHAAARVVRYETRCTGAGPHQAEMSGATISRRIEHDFSDRDALSLRRAWAASVTHARQARNGLGGGRAPLRPARLVGIPFRLGPALALERAVGIREPAGALFLRATAAPRLGARLTPVRGQSSAAAQRERAGHP